MRLGDWETCAIPPLEFIIEPWLPVGGIVLLHGPRGISKTNVGMGIALAVAEGNQFLYWQVPHARKVLYIDGEMQMPLVRDRLVKFQNHTERKRARRNLEYLSYAEVLDQDPDGFGDLAREGYGRKRIHEEIVRFRGKGSMEPILLILDNKACLMSTQDENAATPELHAFLDWLTKLRAFNVSTILIHHDGKGGKQHGTSSLERRPDTIVHLTQPTRPTQGCIPVCWEFDKLRSSTPEQEQYFINIRYNDEDKLAWLEETEAGMTALEIAVVGTKQNNPEMSYTEIAKACGARDKVEVHRILKRHGLLDPQNAQDHPTGVRGP